MKITEFLKKYSLIDNKFIDDFYTFYDEGKNEYDFTIKLDLVATWLNVRKDDLKRLLISNFNKNVDYTEKKVSGLKGTGVNNRIDVLLTYTCSKLLCMISKSEKASIIRNFYIELEKLIITYKDNIVNDLNKQLGIQQDNKEIIKKNDNTGLIYILKVEDKTYKIGTSYQLKKRMKQYNVGRIDELPIVYVFKCDNIKEVEKCIKQNLEDYKLKKHKNNEIFKVDENFIKDTIIYCNKKSIKLKQNKKLFNSDKDTNWLIIIDKKNIDETQLYKPVKKYTKKVSKKSSKKSIKINKNK
jgi:phage anti-repressor protein/predicted GIY-YIG superfamily endonuclease